MTEPITERWSIPPERATGRDEAALSTSTDTPANRLDLINPESHDALGTKPRASALDHREKAEKEPEPHKTRRGSPGATPLELETARKNQRGNTTSTDLAAIENDRIGSFPQPPSAIP